MKHAVYMERKARGLCVNCGIRPAAQGSVKCEKCKETDRRSAANRKKASREDGTCADCGRKIETGRLCAFCADKHRRSARELYARKRDAGLCVNCGRVPAMPGQTKCAVCAEKQKAKSQARRIRLRAEGRCVRCGRPTPGGEWHCFECRLQASRDYYARKERRAAEKEGRQE